MQRFLQEYTKSDMGYPVIAANSTTFSKADPLTINASGFLIVATAGTKIIGFSLEDVTTTSTNQTVAMYCPQYVKAQGVVMAFTADQAAVQGDVGGYADLSGTTGAIQINLATGATGQFLVLGIGPLDNGTTTTEVAVTVAEPQDFAFAQS